MQALAPYSPPDESFYPTETLVSKLNPKYLSRIKVVNPDIFDFAMLDIVGMKAYNIFWKYLAHGAIYSTQESIFLRTFNDIRIFTGSVDQVKCVIYRHQKELLEKIEEFIPYKDFYGFLDHYIREFTGNVEPLHVDLLTTRYYESLPIDITVTKAAFDQFEKLGLSSQVFLIVKADIDDVITVLPAFFNRLHALFINPHIFQVNALVAPVLSNRRALHVAQNTLKTLENERTVNCTTGMQRVKHFDMKDLYVKLSLGCTSYVFSPKKHTESTTSFLRILINFTDNLPQIEMEVQGIDSRLQ